MLEAAGEGGLDDVIDRAVLLEHAQIVVDAIIATQLTEATLGVGDPRVGAFFDDGRTTPAATRMEGLTAAATFLAGMPTVLSE